MTRDNARTTPPLVRGYLERISSKVFSDFPKELTDLVGQQHGVYALYKGDRLYYVGLASNLRNRIKNHLRDRHGGKWDRFSLYLVRKADHIGELESLILRIADPRGNKARGRLQHAQNLRGKLDSKIKAAQERQRREILGRKGAKRSETLPTTLPTGRSSRVALAPYVRQRFMLRGWRKGESYTAWVRRDGRISYDGRDYDSPSAAGKAASGQWVNGWKFWRFKDKSGKWVPLDILRKTKGEMRPPRGKTSASRNRRPSLAPYVNKSFDIRMIYKGRTIKAHVRADGTIRYAGTLYTSPSVAAARARGKRTVNGWKVWKFKNAEGEWVYLDELRKGRAKAA